jgi:uncharacterized membrane protein YgaE (UPF0421/DUF939 family)
MFAQIITLPLSIIRRSIGLISGILKLGVASIAGILRFIIRRIFGTIFGALLGLLFGSGGIGIHMPWHRRKTKQ